MNWKYEIEGWLVRLVWFVTGFLCATILHGCGAEASDCHQPNTMIAGDCTEEELHMLVEVLGAIKAAGYSDPGYFVTFLHSENHELKGTTWKDFRVNNFPPKNSSHGYNGYCDREFCMIYVTTFWNKSYVCVRNDLLHEMVHALGFDHGDGQAELERVQNYIRTFLP